MTTTLDRIAELKKASLPGRLSKGAEILGQFWRDKVRCKNGWRQTCSCGSETSRFCEVKAKWLGLLQEFHGGWPYDLVGNEEYFVIEAMTVRQFEASGLTALVQVPGARKPLRIGPKGTQWRTLIDLACLPEGDDLASGLEAVMKLQEKF
jgi:hypothetical protein